MPSTYKASPIDRATACVTYLCAIDSLLSAANGADLHVVNSSDLGMLIMHIREELDTALEGVSQQLQGHTKPHLRPVSQ